MSSIKSSSRAWTARVSHRVFFAHVVAWVVSIALSIASQVDAAEPLSLQAALQLAEARSQRLAAQDAAANAARELAVAAAERPDPVGKVGLLNLPINTADRFSVARDSMTTRAIGVSQELTRSDKLVARAARFEREADAAAAGRTLALSELQRDTALAWFDRYYLEEQRRVIDAQREEARLQVETSDTAYRSARGSQADAFAARTAVAMLDDRLAQADRQIASSTTRLARWIGDAAGVPLGRLPATETVPYRAGDLDRHVDGHPQIALLTREEEVAEAEARSAQADKKPDWSVELMYGKRGPAYSDMVSINFSIPLQWDQKNRQDRQVAAKLALAEQKRAERDEALRSHRAEVETMLQEWESDRERLARYDRELIPLAEQRTAAAAAAWRGGSSGGLNPVLEARRALLDARLERLRLELEAARLWAQLTFLTPSTSVVASRSAP